MTDAEPDELTIVDRYWAAANYLTIAQIYLRENPLLHQPLQASDIKPRLLGHWGTSPALSFVYAHANRVIKNTGRKMLFVAGPGHGGPAVVANTYLEGSYTEYHPAVSRDVAGLTTLVRQFSTPGGIGSHTGPSTPGSLHEGGELGYSLVHATGAVLDHPDLTAVCVVGDGEAETGPLATSWSAPRFLNPRRDGAVLPVLNLNRFKISGPTLLGTLGEYQLRDFLRSHGWDPVIVDGHDDHRSAHQEMVCAFDQAIERIHEIQDSAKRYALSTAAIWPALILRSPKGWTGPRRVDGQTIEGTHRAHQVPLKNVKEDPRHLAQLEEWLLSYRPQDLFDSTGRPTAIVQAAIPPDTLKMGRSAAAHGHGEPLAMPPLRKYELTLPNRGAVSGTTRPLGRYLQGLYEENPRSFRLFSPDEASSNKLDAVFKSSDRCLLPLNSEYPAGTEHVSPEGRVMEVLSEHLCQGWAEGYTLTGRHALFASYEAFAMVSASMAIQHAKWLQHSRALPWRHAVPSLNVLLTSTCWRNDHNGFSHQGPGLIDAVLPLSGDVVRVYLPPDANTLLVCAENAFESRDKLNLIVADKQDHPQYLSLHEAQLLVHAGADTWEWASSTDDTDPDIVLAAAGDIMTHECLAAAWMLRRWIPGIRLRFVSVVDVMALAPRTVHPHGLTEEKFSDLFTPDTDVVFAWHGYARALHQLLHGRPDPGRFHVRGYQELGSTTTPFDMVVQNHVSRYHLVLLALTHLPTETEGIPALREYCLDTLRRHHHYVRNELHDMPEIDSWHWTDPDQP